MKATLAIAMAASLVLMAGCGRGQNQTAGTEGQNQQAATPSQQQPAGETAGGMAGAAPSFSQLDKNGDGSISYDEAQTDPTLAKYWQDHNLGQQHKMDQSEFSQFETSAGAPPSGQPAPGTESTPPAGR